ncbi:DUF2254 domain-containing protein [Roseococcus suduntuyensis]|uniref:DUF2254 domain-containing protein n=1 Tax=Roseococcus suduntuyensis TaxID=455361 RepID=UPI001A904CB8|nr:DUF2254 domain-containing protein [Roseococcus suduntuyensis]
MPSWRERWAPLALTARLRATIEALGDIFWIRPGLLVLGGALLGQAMVMMEQADIGLPLLPENWLYGGGEAGARDMLGAIAASTIGVAGTTFSITVAALSLASGQMGPRLLRNFVRDPGNQMALGIFLGTFAYCLVVLRTVRSMDEGSFVPQLGITLALLMALVCVATLVRFVHHIASSINVETVIEGVHAELLEAVELLEEGAPLPPAPHPAGTPVTLDVHGYLRAVDADALADWAAARQAVLVLNVRPGHYLFPCGAVAEVTPATETEAAREALRDALALGPRQAATQDLEFAVRQLVEVALRALSPGINDPFTAVAVLDRLGATLCALVPRRLPASRIERAGRTVLHRRVTDYAGLCDAMFHTIRQSAAGNPAVMIRLVEVLGRVRAVEPRAERRAELDRHVALVLAAGRIALTDPADAAALEACAPRPD